MMTSKYTTRTSILRSTFRMFPSDWRGPFIRYRSVAKNMKTQHTENTKKHQNLKTTKIYNIYKTTSSPGPIEFPGGPAFGRTAGRKLLGELLGENFWVNFWANLWANLWVNFWVKDLVESIPTVPPVSSKTDLSVSSYGGFKFCCFGTRLEERRNTHVTDFSVAILAQNGLSQ